MRVTYVLVAAMLLSFGCSSSSSSSSSSSDAMRMRFEEAQSWGVVSEGNTAEFALAPSDECWASCVAERASCSDLESMICSMTPTAVDRDYHSLCEPPVPCGDGSTVPGHTRCAGCADCLDGADERSCDS